MCQHFWKSISYDISLKSSLPFWFNRCLICAKEFKNDKFIAFADRMIANYEERNNDEIFTIIELFDNVVIEFEEETFKGNYAIYTREDNIIKLSGNVSIESPSRLLTGNELIADIDNNKRILNSANKESLVEVLLENNAND